MPWFFVFDEEPTSESGLLGKWWHHDPAQAKQLLAAAGMPDLTIPLVYYEYGTNEKSNSFLADQFRSAGITLRLEKLEYTVYNSQWTGRKIEDAADGWQSAGFDIDNYFYRHIVSTSPSNRWRINNPQLDQLAERQSTELDAEQRKEYLREIWDIMVDKMYRVEKPFGVGFSFYSPKLHGTRWTQPLQSVITYYDFGTQMQRAWLEG
jgi:ABC-type transport system substrate-binding protein